MGFKQKNPLYRETEVVVFNFSLISYDVFIKLPPNKKRGQEEEEEKPEEEETKSTIFIKTLV